VIRSSLGPAFLTSIAIHLGALMVLSLAWGWLRLFSPRPSPHETQLIMVVPVPQPAAPTEPEDIAVPPPATEEEVPTVPPPPPPDEPMTPPQVDPITPPKVVEQTAPKPAQPHPKPQPSPKPARIKKPPPEITNEAALGQRGAPAGGDRRDAKPGPRVPFPDEAQEKAAGNVLGPSSTPKAEDRPSGPVEGGEAGAGNLFERGDVEVVPGAGVGGGSGARGRSGLGLGDEGGGTRVRGVRPGPGGEGADEGGGSTSLPRGGYQVKPRYPDSARRQGIEGTVVVKAYVTEQGRVIEVQVEQSAGHPDLDRAAVEAVGRWRFEPAQRGRQPVAMWVSIPVKFVLSR
jgi:periplasmic protein TonB